MMINDLRLQNGEKRDESESGSREQSVKRKAAEPRTLCSPGSSPGNDAARKTRPAVQGAE